MREQSLVLSSYLETKHKEGLFGRGKRVIEFGTGCGLVAISAAILGASVTATDCPWVLPLTVINVDKNNNAIATGGGCVMCKDLVWGLATEPPDWPEPFDYALVADCVYSDTAVLKLLYTMHAILTEDTLVFFAFQEHNPDATQAFWKNVSKYFTYQRVSPQSINHQYQDSGINLLEMKKAAATRS